MRIKLYIKTQDDFMRQIKNVTPPMLVFDSDIFWSEYSGKLTEYSCQTISLHWKVTEFSIKHNMPTAIK